MDADFDSDIFKPIFDHHLDKLNNLKTENPVAYHVLMNILYMKVMCVIFSFVIDISHQFESGCREEKRTANIGKKQRSALAVANLSAFV